MAIKNIIADGIGFSPGSIKYIISRGLSLASAITSSPVTGSLIYTGTIPVITYDGIIISPITGTLIYIGSVPQIETSTGLLINSPETGNIIYSGNIPVMTLFTLGCWDDISVTSSSWLELSEVSSSWLDTEKEITSWTNIPMKVC